MDDFCVWGSSKEDLKRAKGDIEEFLANRLNLQLKEKVTRLASVSYGLPFLGFRLFPHTIRMKRDTLRRFVEKVRRYDYSLRNGLLAESRVSKAVQSIYSFVRIADSERFLINFAARFAP